MTDERSDILKTETRVGVSSAVAPALDHLRSYQKRDFRDVLARCERVRKVLYVAFMGSGKTVLAAALIRTWLARGERILILTHTREILRQTHDKLVAAGVEENRIGWIWREHPRTAAGAPVQLASLDTLRRRELPTGITRLIVDEAHHAPAKKWRDVIAAYPHARVLGLTGTPVRLDGQPLGDVFDEMIESEPVETLIEHGWISRPTTWTPMWDVVLPRRSGGGDFSDLVAAGLIPHSRVLESMVAEYSKHASGLPAVGFAATQEKAIQYAAHFNASGIPAETLFGSDTDLKRQGMLARLRKGTLRVLWTCNVLAEGWDYPGLRCVMLARPTLSISRYLQQIARCMRPGTPPVVLDLWGAFKIFDPPWADFGWDLHTRTRRSLYTSERSATGEVTWFPPVENKGELVRADTSVRMLCVVCGKPATRSSASHALRRAGGKSYCSNHTRGTSAKKPLPPCAICGDPATPGSAASARAKGRRPYCENHKGGTAGRLPSLPCTICGEPSTKTSVKASLRRGHNPYCEKHKKDPVSRRMAPLPCAVCGAPTSRRNSANARAKGQKTYCIKHKGGPVAKKPLLPCAICGEPATHVSSLNAHRKNDKPFCEKHKKGRLPPLPCAICGEPATKTSSETARYNGCRPFCEKHKGGSQPLLPCAICGNTATRSSSNNALRKHGKAYCEIHKKGPIAITPLLPCVICQAPATRTSSNAARTTDKKPYCEKHKGGPQAKLAPLPCAICGEASTKISSRGARHSGGRAYCERHKGAKNSTETAQ